MVTDIPCKVAPIAKKVLLHLLHGDGALPRKPSTSGTQQGLAQPRRVSIASLKSPGGWHFSPETLPHAPENIELENMDDVYKVMRRASISPPPQRYLDFNELWKQFVNAALKASGAGRAEKDHRVPAVPDFRVPEVVEGRESSTAYLRDLGISMKKRGKGLGIILLTPT